MANVYGLIFEIDDRTKSGARSINNTLNGLQRNAQRVSKALGGISSVAGSAVSALGKTAVAATAAATAFGFLAKKNLDVLDNLGKTATKLGVSTKFLSEYSFVANQAGISTDQFNTGLQRFLRRLGQAQQGTGELVKPLQRLGISMKDSNGNFRDGTDVFEEFISKLGSTTNQAQKLALAMGAFDTEGVAFINVADQGATEIARLRREAELAGLSINNNLTSAAEEANDALGELLARARGFALNFFGAMAPAIKTLADDIKKAIDDAVAGAGGMESFANKMAARFLNAAADLIQGISIIFDGFIDNIRNAVNIIQRLIVAVSKIPGAGFDAMIGDPNDLLQQRSKLNTQLEEQKRLLKENQDLVESLSQQYNELDGGIFGKNDPNNIIGQIEQATLSQVDLVNNIEKTESALAGLDNTFVFKQLETGAKGAQTATAGFVEELRKIAAERIKIAEDTSLTIEEQNINKLRFAYKEYYLSRMEGDRLAAAAAEDAKNKQQEFKAAIVGTSTAVSGYDRYIKDLVNNIRSTMIETEYLGRAQETLNEMFRMGKISGEEYSAILKVLNGEVKNTAEETIKASTAMNGFQKYMNDLVTASRDEVQQLKYAGASQDELNRLFREGKITGEEYSAALETVNAALGIVSEGTDKTSGTVDDGIISFKKYSDALKTTATNTVNETKYLKQLKTQLEAAKKSTEGLTEAQKEQLKIVDERLAKGKQLIEDNTFEVLETLEDRLGSIAISTADTFADVILGLKDGFESLEDIALNVLRTIISTLIEAQIRKVILNQGLGYNTSNLGTGLLGNVLGGLGGLGASTLIPGLGILAGAGMLLGGLFADGGNTAKAGQKPIVVGERGPELFMPGKAGTVVSNEELNSMGGQGDLNVSFTINAIDTQTGVEFLLENKRVITGVIQEAYMRRGTSGPLG